MTRKGRISGRVNGRSSNFISIVYEQDKNRLYALGFSVDRNTRAINKDDISQITRGDLVVVDFEETLGRQGSRQKVIERTAKIVQFIDEGVRFRAIKQEKLR